MSLRVLYDGWPLIYQPDGPATLHLGALLALAPSEVQPLVALPLESSPEGFLAGFELVHRPGTDASAWQQRALPELAKEHGATLIHSTSTRASLFGGAPTVVSPTGYDSLDPAERSLRARLGAAAGRGGLARAALLHPSDTPAPNMPGNPRPIRPALNPSFKPAKAEPPADLELPESYILYHGPSHPGTLLALLESWTWAAASIGDYYPLVLLGLAEEAKRFVEARLPEFHLEDYVHILPRVHPAHLAPIYQAAEALAHPAPPSVWGNPIRHALACSVPVAAYKYPGTEALVADAAYLVEPGDLRAFGAAMITSVVHDEVRGKLQAAAQKRSAHWDVDAFKSDLLAIYQELA